MAALSVAGAWRRRERRSAARSGRACVEAAAEATDPGGAAAKLDGEGQAVEEAHDFRNKGPLPPIRIEVRRAAAVRAA
jgi:hypothetical protein